MIKRNVAANIAGGIWIALLTIAITPLQVHLLGVESYGIIGFIMTLQVALGIFDLGLSATLTRELAGDHSEGRTKTLKLVQTARSVYWALALVLGSILLIFLTRYADHWFNARELNVSEMTIGMGVAAIYLALRWPVAFYTGILSGIQRMDVLNGVKVGAVSIRLVGGIGVLLAWRDLEIFLIWLAFSALLEVTMYAHACRKYFRAIPGGFSIFTDEIVRVWRYTLSLNVIAILSLLLTQTDRLIVSKMLELETLGYYMLAYTAASAILIVQLGISSAMFPAYAHEYDKNGRDALAKRYLRATQMTLYLVGFVAFPLVFFGESILKLWVGGQVAASSWYLLALLATGFIFSAASTNAYQAAIACKAPKLPLNINLLVILPYLAALYFSIMWLGAKGAAFIWILLNLTYVVTLVPMVHRKILAIHYSDWLFKVLLRFLLAGSITFGLFRMISLSLALESGLAADMATYALLLLAVAGYGVFGFFLLDEHLRLEVKNGIERAWAVFKKEKKR